MRQRSLTAASVLCLALASSAGVGSYTLRPGDTLGALAAKLRVSVSSLAKANRIANPNRVAVGQVLQVPAASATSNSAKAARPRAGLPAATSGTYTVVKGDSLSRIASRLDVSVDALVKANRLTKRNLIVLGQKLIVPAGASSPAATASPSPGARATTPSKSRTYVVARGDTLSGIAQRLGLKMSVLVQANKLMANGMLFEGQILAIPGGTDPSPVTAKPGSSSGVTLSMAPIASVRVVVSGLPPTYVVAPRDTASKIASRHRISVSALSKANGGRSLQTITPGMVLNVPGKPAWLCPVRGSNSFVDTWGAPRIGATHKGTDVFGARGTPIVASVGGTLEVRNGSIGGHAYYLRGDDGNTYYGAHLDTITAAPGRLAAGQQIGTLGDTGDAKGTPPHLHFEVHPGGGLPVNPYYTLEKWC